MSLATRCPDCGTTFRIVSDQLKLRRGLVRCGRCRKVFNGFENLLYVSASGEELASTTGEFPKWAIQPPAPSPPSSDADADNPQTIIEIIGELDQPVMVKPKVPVPQEPAPPPAPTSDPAPALAQVEPPASPNTPSDHPIERSTSVAPTTQPEVERRAYSPRLARASLSVAPSPVQIPPLPAGLNDLSADDDADFDLDRLRDPSTLTGQSTAPQTGNTDLPEFLRTSGPKVKKPRVWGWATGIVLLCTLFVAQLAWVFRSDIAARMPELRQPMERLCGNMGCEIGFPRRSQDVDIESNELQPIVGGRDALMMVLVLRNKGDTDVAWPALELTLTDISDRPLARKVFFPTDYLPYTLPDRNNASTEPTIALLRRAEPVIRLPLDTSALTARDKHPAGYRVGIFYP